MSDPKQRPFTREDALRDFTQVGPSLFWLTGPRNGNKAGWSDGNGYRLIRYLNKLVREHHLVWLMNTGDWPNQSIDHINNIPWDNRFENLRLATQAQQSMNQSLQKRREGKYKGVHQSSSGKFYVKIKHKGVQLKRLGSFTTAEEAAKAYNDKALELFGLYAKLNNLED